MPSLQSQMSRKERGECTQKKRRQRDPGGNAEGMRAASQKLEETGTDFPLEPVEVCGCQPPDFGLLILILGFFWSPEP